MGGVALIEYLSRQLFLLLTSGYGSTILFTVSRTFWNTMSDTEKYDEVKATNTDSSASNYYWQMFLENCEHGRHHESQRQSVSNLTLILVGAATTVIAHGGIEPNDRWLSAFIVFLGIFGAAFSYKCYERFRCHMARAAECITRLETLVKGLNLESIVSLSNKAHAKSYQRISKIRLYWFWAIQYFFIVIFGGVLFHQTY